MSKNVQQTDGQIGDGVALTSMEHPPGLIEAMADAIMTGKLSLKRKRAPNGTFDRTAYQREYMRRRRQKEQKT